jgi:hypothetical protein
MPYVSSYSTTVSKIMHEATAYVWADPLQALVIHSAHAQPRHVVVTLQQQKQQQQQQQQH